MDVKVQEQDGATVVAIKGEVTMGCSRKLRDVLKDVTGKKAARIVIDLKEMPYIDSSGLATLVECFQETKKYKAELRLAELTTNVREVFRLARLDTIFSIYPSTADALS